MKILQLCLRVPFPLLDGGNIAMYQATLALLKAGHTVHLLALNTQKHFVQAEEQQRHAEKWLGEFGDRCRLESVSIDTTVKPLPALIHLLRRRSYNIDRFYDKSYAARLGEILRKESYDIVQLESLFMTPYLDTVRKHSTALAVLRAHNVEHIIWERLAAAETSPLKKIYLQLLVKSLRRYELRTLPKLDAILAITPEDASQFKKLGYNGAMMVLPVSVPGAGPRPDPSLFRHISLYHLGSMDWMPNDEGVRWFLANCWPAIHAAWPELRLFLAGRGFPSDLAARGYPNVTCKGEIADAEAYSRNKPVMIVPLLSGSGMRVKIIQGMAAGKVIISTTIGAEGIACIHGKDILVADTPSEFLEAVNRCMKDPEGMSSISDAARKLVEEQYSAAVVGKKLNNFYSALEKKNEK